MAKALCGCDYIRSSDGKPMDKTLGGWMVWAKREADRQSKRDRFLWHPVVAWIDFRGAYRVSFGSMPENIIKW